MTDIATVHDHSAFRDCRCMMLLGDERGLDPRAKYVQHKFKLISLRPHIVLQTP
jgi:hypothetical protein